MGVRVGLAPCWNKLALRKKLKNLNAKSQLSIIYSFRDLSVHTDEQTKMARSTRIVILIKNIYTLWGQKRPSLGVSLPPFPVVTVMAAHCPRWLPPGLLWQLPSASLITLTGFVVLVITRRSIFSKNPALPYIFASISLFVLEMQLVVLQSKSVLEWEAVILVMPLCR